MAMLLSLRMTNMSGLATAMLLRASKASPPVSAPSPMTATTWCLSPPMRRAASDMPSAAEMELEAWPQAKVSYSLSSGEGKGRMPWSLRLVWKASRRPVRILCP